MRTFTKYLFAVTVATSVALTACTDGDNSATTSESDTTQSQTDTVALQHNGDMLFRGIAIDGSRRYITVKVDDDTLDFELPPAIDFTWEVGDSLSIYVVQSSNGADSITTIDNITQQNATSQ